MTGNDGSLVIVIGRGNSGTRILAHTLYGSGVYMGRRLNEAGDKVPPTHLYNACRVIARHVDWNGDLSWDFDRLHSMPIDLEHTELVDKYLEDVHSTKTTHKGWKLPETTLVYPWIVRMFPHAKYIHIVRDPRDCLLGPHITDDLGKFEIPCPDTVDKLSQRVASWKYQQDIVKATPVPQHFISVRYEDLVLDQEMTLRRLEKFLGIPLARIVVDRARVGRWKSHRHILPYIQPLVDDMREWGYDGAAI